MKEHKNILETELYQPIHDYFVKLGFKVHAEVNGCDLTASKDGELIIIELKLNLNLDLLIQAVKRQRLTEYVYIVIPRPNFSMFSRKWKDLCFLVRRLELGLITVSLKGENPQVDIILNPSPFNREKSIRASQRKTKSIIAEIQGRHGNYNVGGSTRTKIMTAYKENVIHIACCLKKYGQLSPKKLREMGTGKKTLSILNKNFYGWFERVERGIYKLSDQGYKELADFPELVAYYTKELSQIDEFG
ncbi:MAG: hypothetical protein GX994_00895 [Firmicutes bacterium]|nr:hypothetical protein [Bacillota bacterium]